MICIVEPTYAGFDHAPFNAAIIRATALAFPNEPICFASTPEHRAHVEQLGPLPARLRTIDIDVPATGGQSVGRIVAQWRALRIAIRESDADRVLLLSSAGETFFAIRLVLWAFLRVRLFVVLHGNLVYAVGWRSKDPRHRLIDYRTGMRVARSDRVRLIVLEPSIKDAAMRLGVPGADRFLVWPHPINEDERDDGTPLDPDRPIRIAFLGAATRRKNFHEFVALVRRVTAQSARYRFSLIGFQMEDFSDAADVVDLPAAPLDRAAYIAALCAVDYVLLPLAAPYELSASGTLLDCVTTARPIMALNLPAARTIAQETGDIGFICGAMEEMETLLFSGDTIADPARHAAFRAHLRAAAATRTPAALAPLIRDDLTR
ncbi:glycosyltransferase family 4 protein [Sphingomonas montanisoli]|uniref:Glycosyltransferase family 4 protein n=1 Tax=Sphingomonas montanisoli TaxID=2606412 RepID=A0A5D9BYG0_9SPHN|nr:glycosyltransferase family 4 protein [Sphingomonas montanisoli]TZG24172.1 glycosyltransferase family 4 protein [Sphingomonas montanisoli]